MDAQKIVAAMLQEDAFSRWLGVDLVALEPGDCTLQMSIREDMLNGFGIAHGGIAYSLADSALAFASNARGRKAVSVETSISHTQQLRAGDILTARAQEEHLGGRIAIYRVELRNQEGAKVAIFKGVVYRTNQDWHE
jgi:acyl-CoA thioesterase